jgi:DNA-binding MarR family transcriptional regulator
LVPLVAGGLHASDLADQLRVSRQAVAQGVAALERHGYVSRVPDPVDARAQIIELTPRGRQALRVMRSNALNVEKRWEKALGPERLDELREPWCCCYGRNRVTQTRNTVGVTGF